MSEFRVAKGRLEATLTLSDGRSVRGYVFVSSAAALHGGPERIKDLLNADTGFFPFELVADGTPRTVLYHRDHVVFLTLGPDTEAEHDAGYEVAVRRSVTVLLSSGLRLDGHVRIHTPPGRDRLSDYARMPEQFRYLETPDHTLIINTRHVLELMETGGS